MYLFFFIAICFSPLIISTIILLIKIKDFTFIYAGISTLVGLAALIPIAVLQFYVFKLPFFTNNSIGGFFLICLFCNGLIEETVKMTCLNLLPLKKMSFENFFACCLTAGFAFGSFESVVYLISSSEPILLRLFSAVFVHASCLFLSGFLVYSKKSDKLSVFPFIHACVIHGLYNFFIGLGTYFKFFAFIVITFAIIRCFINVKITRNKL